MKTFPPCHASKTARGLSAGIFTQDGSFNVLDATAPGMTPEISLERAEFMVKAAANHETYKSALENAANGFDLLAANLLRQSGDAKFGAWFKSAAQMASDGAKQIRETLQP